MKSDRLNTIANRSTVRRAALGLAGLLLCPMLLLVDTALAIAGGWKLAEAGAFRHAPLAAGLVALAASILFAGTAGRARLAARASHWWALSVAVLIGVVVSSFVRPLLAPVAEFHRRPAGVTYRFEPNPDVLLGVSGPAASTIDALGLRGPELPPRDEAYRILCVGGSETECYYLDDGECWPALLMHGLNANQPSRRAWIGAAAVSELASGDHRRFLAHDRLPPEMDCWLLMPGANDLLRLLLGFSAGERPPLWFESAPVQSLRDVWNGRLGNGFIVDRTGEDITLYRLTFSAPRRSPPDVDAALARFEQHVRGTIDSARSAGVRIVLGCPPTLWSEELTPQGKKRLLYARVYPQPRDEAWWQAGWLRDAMQRYNQRLQAVCADEQVECVAETLRLNGREDCFYDDTLLNEQGCRELADILLEHFRQRPLAGD